MKKVLFVASVIGHFKVFHMPYIEYFKEKGYQVEAAAKLRDDIEVCDIQHNICFERNPFKVKNFSAYRKLKKLINGDVYDIIHCHTPVAAMMTRLAARKSRKKGTRVIYTAHGFHFFKGAPLLNWLIYFPVEWICAFFTDTLITINEEDFAFAKKHLHTKDIKYVRGVGVNVDKIKNASIDYDKKREELGIPKDALAVLSVGELNSNKNHETVLRAIAALSRKDIVYVVCGKGGKKEYLENLAKELGIAGNFISAGYRSDIPEVLKCCDIFAFPSLREGLPVSVMEAMFAGMPIVASDIRGNRDLIKDGKNGFLCRPTDVLGFAENIRRLAENKELRDSFGEQGKMLIVPFTKEEVMAEMSKIYG